MYKLSKNDFTREISKAKTEEEVKFAFAKFFKIKFDAKDKHDLYTPQILFEFKYDKSFQNLKARSEILAQALYYVHRLKFSVNFSEIEKPIPPIICLADKNEVCFFQTIDFREIYQNIEKYDWDLAPSQPDKKLIADLYQHQILRNVHVYSLELDHDFNLFSEQLYRYLNEQLALELKDKKVITEENFEEIYKYWEHLFGEAVYNGQKPSKYFVSDIQTDRTIIRENDGKVLFRLGEQDWREKKILTKDYYYFWNNYEKVTDSFVIRGILAKIDRLTSEHLRRFHGEFFTPLLFAKKGLEYIEKTIGKNWWQTGEYRLWDMAAGTGNLEYHLPNEVYQYCYLSSLFKEDVEHCEKLFPDATHFQYDYLNDDIENVFLNKGELPLFSITWKLPEKLRHDLANPNLKWIILINPPFATSQTAGTSGNSKKDVSNTAIRKKMHEQNLGEVSRELSMQFLFRIKTEFKSKQVHLGLFYKVKYINANNDQKFRDTIFQFEFEKGFAFSSANFSGTSKNSPFPVGFLVWNLSKQKTIEEQEIILDVFDERLQKIGQKYFQADNRNKHLSKWIDRPKGIKIFPAFKSGIEIDSGNKDVRDRVSEHFIGSLMCKGNDFQNQNFTAILSGPYVSAGAHSITPEIFEQSMVVHAVRRIPKATWLNDRDQFMQPNFELPKSFINSCVIWSLFSNSNQTVSIKNVLYKNEIYQIHNHFFPFTIDELRNWNISDSEIKNQLPTDENRFVANWIKKQKLNDIELKLLEQAKEAYKFYFSNLHQLRTKKFKIETWDAGWFQIRNCLSDQNLGDDLLINVKNTHNELKQQLLEQIYELGFL